MFIAKIIGKDFHNKFYINVTKYIRLDSLNENYLWKLQNTCDITQLNVNNIYVM